MAISAQPEQEQIDGRNHAATGRFLHSLYILLRATALYNKTHPRVRESLAEAQRDLHEAAQGTALIVRVERGRMILPGVSREKSADWLAGYRTECDALAEEFERRGVTSISFDARTSAADLQTLAELLQPSSRKKTEDPQKSWGSLLAAQRIGTIRVNISGEHRTEAALATLLAALLAHSGSLPEEKEEAGTSHNGNPEFEQSETETAGAITLLAKLAPRMQAGREGATQEAANALRATLKMAERRSVATLARHILRETPRTGDSTRVYLLRLGETLALDFAGREFLAHRMCAAAVRPTLARLAQETANILQGAGAGSSNPAVFADWAEESYVEKLYERFWEALPAREIIRVLDGNEAWATPVGIVRRTLGQFADAGDAESRRRAQGLLMSYSSCLQSEDGKARRAVAAGLLELHSLIEGLCPEGLPDRLVRSLTDALVNETSPGIAGLLSAATENLARTALRIEDFAGFEDILTALEQAPHDEEHMHLAAFAARIMASEDWLLMVDAGLSAKVLSIEGRDRSSEAVLPRLLRRDPERAVDRLGVLLGAPNGADAAPAMARLVRAIGEPAIGALVARLAEPRRQRAATAVKLLAEGTPERLLAALPRVLPSWDWSLQDLAISELARPPHHVPLHGLARVLVGIVPEAHPMVVPAMLDQIGQEGERSAIPLLLEIAAGTKENLRDVFIRIKAVEALGRLRATEAAEMMRGFLRQRNGLTHAEPAGLRAAAEEALALIEFRPSSARVRTEQETAEKAGADFMRPRRYLRIPLEAPLTARIEGSRAAAARVRTISLGGAFLESRGGMSVGESLRLEIRSGLRRMRATAIVRNLAGSGGGVEFVHMKPEDRERLRRLVRRYAED